MKNFKIAALAIIAIISFASCSKDDNAAPQAVNEEEVITTVTATFTGGGQVITLVSRDLDGDGPNAPVVTVSGNFQANTTYNGSLTFMNEAASPAEDITPEIIEEGVDHQIFYRKTGNLNAFEYAATADNFDSNGKPIGLKSVFTTTNAASGTVTITLRHLPNKNGAGVSGGDITNAAGGTDAEVTFPVTVQ